MKKTLLFVALMGALFQAQAAVKPCDELKTEIAAKFEKNGVNDVKLSVVATDKVGDAKVVGSCNGGSSKVVLDKR